MLSSCLAADSVCCEAASDCSISSSLFKKKAVGPWLDAPLWPTEGSATLDLWDRGLAGGRASPPGSGRMLSEVESRKARDRTCARRGSTFWGGGGVERVAELKGGDTPRADQQPRLVPAPFNGESAHGTNETNRRNNFGHPDAVQAE